MSIATEKLKRSTARWMLIRLNPARYVSDSLASAGGGVYTMSFNLPISSVERNGTPLTKVTLDPPSSNDTYYYDQNTSTFKVKLASAPNSTTNIIIIKYYIFYTTSEGEHWHETPTNTSTDIRLWQPRIVLPPQIRQGVSNVVYGVFTVEDTSISINNEDANFTQYLTENDSFSDSNVEIWLCITSNDNSRLVYKGKCRNIFVNKSSVDIDIYDPFSRLDQPAYFGDTVNESFFYKTSESFPNMDAKKHGSLNRLIVGNSSRYRTTPAFPLSFFQFKSFRLNSETMPEAINTDFEFSNFGTVNRTWGLCRLLHDGSANSAIASTIWGTKSGAITSGKSTIFQFTTAIWNTMNVEVGDSVKITESSNTDWGIVIAIDFDTPGFTNVEIHTTTVPTFPNFSTAAVITSYPCVSIVINQGGVDFFPIYERDYDVVETTTSGGNKYVKIVFTTSFESNSIALPYISTPDFMSLNPTSDTVFFKIRPNIANIPMHKHGTYLKKMMSSVGVETNDSSFTNANTDLNVGVLTSIPTYQENDYDTYLKYAEDITKSTLSFMFSNTNGQVEYHLLKNSLPSNTRNSDTILDQEINFNIDYRDIYTSVIAYNNNDKSDNDSLENSISTAVNQLASRLYNIVRPKQLVHYLDDITGRINDHLVVSSRPVKTYKISTATLDIETDINDDLTIQSDIVNGSSVEVKVVNIKRDIEKTTIEAIEVSDLSL